MINYYQILDISTNASQSDIKKAYRNQALKWHPDRNKSSDATIRMQQINEAYLILKDEQAKARYDKEYQRHLKTKKKANSESRRNNTDSKGGANFEDETYVFEDEVLKDWIIRARKQAHDLAKQSVEDLLGMTKAASRSAWDATKGYILFWIFLMIALKAAGFY